MFIVCRIKTHVAVFAGLAVLLGSAPLFAGMDCWRCLYGVTPIHVQYCGQNSIFTCEDDCHGKDRIERSTPQIARTVKQADWGQRNVYRKSWIKTPYETTFSPAADRYQLVVVKFEINLSPVAISFRLPEIFRLRNAGAEK